MFSFNFFNGMLYTNKINYLDTHLPIFEISILAKERSKYYGKDQTCGIQYTSKYYEITEF